MGGSSRILVIEQMSIGAVAWPGEFFTPSRAYAMAILGFTALSSVVATCQEYLSLSSADSLSQLASEE